HRHGRPHLYGAWAAGVLGLGHLVSSFAVVGVFIAFDSVFDFSSDIFRYIAGALLLLIAARFWLEKGHGLDHEHGPPIGLRALVVSALVLGFAHEEEFALLGMALGGLNPFVLMTVYALAVLFAMIVITQAGIAAFRAIERRGRSVLPHMTKVSAAVMAFMGIAFLTGLY
ncbi:MAG: hypothetical protein J4N83_05060, partial [Chloroflexi bacterium]|nr:hypothetical protein [Chloroflexota bacterium]